MRTSHIVNRLISKTGKAVCLQYKPNLEPGTCTVNHFEFVVPIGEQQSRDLLRMVGTVS